MGTNSAYKREHAYEPWATSHPAAVPAGKMPKSAFTKMMTARQLEGWLSKLE